MAGLDDIRSRLAGMPREELIEIAKATSDVDTRERANRAQSYIPNGVCENVIDCFGKGDTYLTLLAAANGVGKSALLANLVVSICYGPQSTWFDGPLFREWPHLKRLRIISDPTTIEEKIVPELEKWMPRGRYTPSKGGKTYLSKWRTDTGFVIDLMTYEQSPKEFESVDLGGLFFDEPPPRAIYRASIGRGRRGMQVFLGLTPLAYAAWIKNEIVDAADQEEAQKLMKRQKRYFTGDIEDNCFVKDTEYLTDKGWRMLEEAKVGDIAATVDLKTKSIEYQAVTNVVRREYEGDVLHLYGGIRCTPGHRIVGRFDGRTDFEIREARELYRGVRMLPSAKNGYRNGLANSPFSKRFSDGDWAEFLGWYLSEGCVTGVKSGKIKNYACYISQNKGEKREGIRTLLLQMGFRVRERKGDLWFTDKEIHRHLFPLGSSGEKFIPEYVFEYERSIQERFYQAMVQGDGDGNNRYFTTSRRLADDLQRLLTLMGYRSSLQEQKQSQKGFSKGSNKILYRVYRASGRPVYVNHKPKPVLYKGIVSCVTVPNGVIIVRAKGKPLVVGNCKTHGVRGILEHKDIENMLKEYPPEERDARAHGKFGHLVGRVHKLFERKIHVLDPFALDPRKYTLYQFLDPHPRTPDAVSWFAVDRELNHYIVDELWIKGAAGDLATEIKAHEQRLGLRVEERYIDPSAYVVDQHVERSLAQELEVYGLRYKPGSKDLQSGIRLTDEALSYRADRGMIIEKPTLFLFSNCERHAWELENYIWDEWKGAHAVDKNPKASPKDANDHFVENIHRAMIAQLRYVPMVRSGAFVPQNAKTNLDPYE